MCFVCGGLVTKLVGCLFVCLLVFVCCLCVCLAVCLIGYNMDPKEGLPRPFQGPCGATVCIPSVVSIVDVLVVVVNAAWSGVVLR